MTYKDDLKEHLLVHLHELLVPLIDVGSLLPRIGVVIVGRSGVALVVLAPVDDLTENDLVDIRDRDGLGHGLVANILHHVLDEYRTLSDDALC